MITEEKQVRTIQTKVVVSKTCTCDRCNKIIFHETMNTPHTHKYDYFKPIQYYKVTTGHNDWGNDSIDSVENLDICEDCGVCTYSQYCDPKEIFVLDSEASYMLIDYYKARLNKLEKEFDEL